MVVTTLRLELPNIAKVAVYLATHYVQTTTNIVIYGSTSLHSPLLGMSPACHTKIQVKNKKLKNVWLPLKECEVLCADDLSGILNPGKTFIHGFLSLIIFLKAGDKHPAIIFNIYTVILHLVTILKPSTVEGTSLRTLQECINDHYVIILGMMRSQRIKQIAGRNEF